jgi:hypothetical protein
MGLTRQERQDRLWEEAIKARDNQNKKWISETVDKIQEAVNLLTELRNNKIIEKDLFLITFDKITEGQNYLVGYMETLK